jgi:pimeloyl-ACP methyl ester carboxylesterase
VKQDEAVVFIHGIWMKGYELAYLSHHLKKQGYQIYHFKYKSLRKTPEKNADSLNYFLEKIKQPIIHLVSHSLGGIIVLHLFDRHPQVKPGKIIMLATPISGSAVAKHIYQHSRLRWILGKSTEHGLLGDTPAWNSEHNIYMIAGKKSVGIGMLLAFKALTKPNDGTVNCKETIAPYIRQHFVVPHSHFSMLISRKVAKKISEILADK